MKLKHIGKHSNSMRAARLRRPHGFQSRLDVSTGVLYSEFHVWERGEGSQVNKFEQVCSLGHQMSLPGEQGWGGAVQWGPMSHG